jgi:hypothetical protein
MQPNTGRSLGLLNGNAFALALVNQYGITAPAAAAVDVFRKSRRVDGALRTDDLL